MNSQHRKSLCSLLAPVSSVVLLEDRAQVTRRGTIELAEGAQRLVVRDVTPLIADRTLQAKALDTSHVRLDEARVRREWRIGTVEQPPDLSELTEKHQELTRELEEREELLGALEKRRKLVEKAVKLLVDDINRRLPYATEVDESWGSNIDEAYSNLESLDSSWLEQHGEIDELSRTLAEVAVRRSMRQIEDPLLTADIELELSVSEPGEYIIEIEYTLPSALWRPIHRATLAEDDRLSFECDAALWQATGEDWDDVQLRFSTARPTQRSDPPLLTDDVVVTRRRRERKVTVDVQETTIATTGEGVAEAADGLPCVDDGGETRLLDASIRTSVAADGRMHRVPLFSFTTEGQVDRICCPELGSYVSIRSVQSNESEHPLLAGPMSLLRGGGYVGRTQMGFVASREKFPIGWGSDDSLRIRRELHEHRERSKLSGRTTLKKTVKLFFSNLDDSEVSFSVQERIPLSEIDKVTIKLDREKTFPPAVADEQGIVTWQVTLPPHGRKDLKLVYTITASSNVQGL